MRTVTYRGPDDWFRIEEQTFGRDVPQKVSDEMAEAVAEYPGHNFEVKSASRKTTQSARQGTTEEE